MLEYKSDKCTVWRNGKNVRFCIPDEVRELLNIRLPDIVKEMDRMVRDVLVFCGDVDVCYSTLLNNIQEILELNNTQEAEYFVNLVKHYLDNTLD